MTTDDKSGRGGRRRESRHENGRGEQDGKRRRDPTGAAIRGARGPGRPPGETPDGVRRALIDAARALCIETGLDATTTKAIARRAGVNPAMINYYFGGKEGLGEAMMRETMQPVLDQLDAAGRAAGAGTITLTAFLEGYMRALSRNPWLPQLVVREVLPANGRFRRLFFDEVAQRAGRVLTGVVAATRKERDGDPAIEEGLVPVTVASIAVFPFLAAPVLEGVLGVDPFAEATVDRLVAHSTAVVRRALGMEAQA